MRRPSLMPVADVGTRRVFEALIRELDAMAARLDTVVNDQGIFIANLPEDIKISTADGDKAIVSTATVTNHVGGEGVAAGALATVENLDGVPDGPTYLKVTGVSAGHQVQATSIATSAVEEAKINAGAVTADKIGAGAVVEAKIGAGAVVEAKIGASAVTEGKIGALAVTTAKIDALAVTDVKLAADAVTTNKIFDSAVSGPKIAVNAVGGSKFKESVINEYQTMGSTDSDAEWDARET